MSCHILGTVGKPLMNRGASSWFYNVSTYGGQVIEYLTIFLLKFYLNQNQKIWGNLGIL